MRASIDDATRFLSLIARPGDVFELRGLSKGRSSPVVTAGYFDDMGKLAAAAIERSGKDDGVYITINPVNPALLARAPANRVRQAGNGETTSDRDVQRRSHLLVDVDPVRPTGISSTEAEHAAAIELAGAISTELVALSWPVPILADSGNGGHLIYAIDLPVDDAGLVKRFLAHLSRKYTTSTLKVDEKVFNPARISKIYGTLTRKGENTTDRPHRVARIISAPESLVVVTREQLEGFAPADQRDTKPSKSPTRFEGENKFDIDAWIAQHIPDAVPSPWSEGRKWLLPVCPFNSDHSRREAYITEKHSGMLAAGCQHESCFKSWKDLRQHFEPHAYDRANGNGNRNGDATRRMSDREPPPEVLYEDANYQDEIDAIAARDIDPATSDSTSIASAPRTIGRTWDDCVEEIYARKDEPWIDIRIGTTVVATCRNGSFVPLVAPSGAGKSTLAIQMLIDHAMSRGPAVYLTYELDGDEACARAIGQLCSFSWASVLRGEVPRASVPGIERLRVLERDDATLANLERVVAEMRKLYPDQAPLVIVDYLQATPAPPGKERGYTANVSVELRRAAKKNRVVLIGVSQASTDNSKKMRSGDLLGIDSAATGAETSQIERDAYVILTLGDRQNVDPDTVSWKLSVAKYRLGSADVVYELHFRGRIGSWVVFGEPRLASEVRDSKTSEQKTKKTAELKRSIPVWVGEQPKPVSMKEIIMASTGNDKTIAAVVKELLNERVLVHVHGVRRGGAALIWTSERVLEGASK